MNPYIFKYFYYNIALLTGKRLKRIIISLTPIPLRGQLCNPMLIRYKSPIEVLPGPEDGRHHSEASADAQQKLLRKLTLCQ